MATTQGFDSQWRLDSASWSQHARKYNMRSGQSLSKPMLETAFVQHFFPKLDARVASGDAALPLQILCLCGGTGPEMELLCERYGGDKVHVLTTDNAQGMVDVANETIAKAGFQDRAEARLMDAMNIDAPDNSFDAVFLILGPMLLPDANKCFQETVRILRPGGSFYTLTPGRMDIHDVMSDVRKAVLEDAGRGATYGNVFKEKLIKTWGTASALKEKLDQSNVFGNVQSWNDETVVPIAEEDEIEGMLESIFANPGMQMMYTGDLSEEEKKTFQDQVQAAFFARRNEAISKGQTYGLKMHANSAWAVKPSNES